MSAVPAAYELPLSIQKKLAGLEPVTGRSGLNRKAGERLPNGEGYRDGKVMPKVLTDKYMQMARMFAQGMSKTEVARRLGVSVGGVAQILNSPIVQEYIATLRLAADQAAIAQQARLMSMSDKALDALEEIVEEGPDRLR